MGWITEWRRKRVLQKHALDDALWRRSTKGLSFLPQVPKLKELVLLFLAEKQFAGAHGMEVTDEMRVAIAAQACLPILELGLDWYRAGPASWSIPEIFACGAAARRGRRGARMGRRARRRGDARRAGRDLVDAAAHDTHINVVIHEFAHKLDMVDGVADGTPPLHPGMDRRA